ncbi:hypothetical protein [Acinetobacter haemolyticus]|uniref:hypothetical protein n=1 Tax=Acinetobacter haemolyticus TaxID=29430 RepID=UPI003AF43313
MSKKITENERAAFDAWHFNDWNDNCGHEFDEVEAKHLYNRVYSHEHNRRERERSFFAWQAATDRANKKTEGCLIVPYDKKTVCVIENMVQQQCDASGVREPLHRLDGWRILEELAESLKAGGK